MWTPAARFENSIKSLNVGIYDMVMFIMSFKIETNPNPYVPTNHELVKHETPVLDTPDENSIPTNTTTNREAVEVSNNHGSETAYVYMDKAAEFNRDLVKYTSIKQQYTPESAFAEIEKMLVVNDRGLLEAALKLPNSSEMYKKFPLSPLYYASPELQNDREIVLAAVKQDGFALEYASPALQKDKEIILAAVKSSGAVLKFAEIKNNPDIVLIVMSTLKNPLSVFSKETAPDLSSYNVDKALLTNRDFLLKAVKIEPAILSLVFREYPDFLTDNPELIRDLVRSNYEILFKARDTFHRSSPEIERIPVLSHIVRGFSWLADKFARLFENKSERKQRDLSQLILESVPQELVQECYNLRLELRNNEMLRINDMDEGRYLIDTKNKLLDDSLNPDQPITVMLYPQLAADHNGAFDQTNISVLREHGQQVLYFECGNDWDINHALELLADKLPPQAKINLVFGGHGSPDSIRFGIKDNVFEKFLFDTFFVLDPSDMQDRGFTGPLNRLASRLNSINLRGCESGRKLAGILAALPELQGIPVKGPINSYVYSEPVFDKYNNLSHYIYDGNPYNTHIVNPTVFGAHQ
ncbi:MAG: DUF4116 domain-containing protein [Candidatus Margulisbacteria bacterium]|jgi:hypothetical protein|nr:DUF4116 domain-containing protein [Candidatus Margulisiibacteriota bacterium]